MNEATAPASRKAKTPATQPTLRVRALRLLARREWSREGLRSRLLAQPRRGGGGGDEEPSPDTRAVDDLLDDFAARGWLSDLRYAQMLVNKRRGRNGKAVIARQLKQAGVAEAAAGEALATLDPEQEYAAALALWRRKFGEPPADEKIRARQIRFLLARGYPLNLVLRVLKEGAQTV